MSREEPESRRQRLVAASAEAAARATAASDTEPPEPGDLFVVPATAGLPVEWALLERHPAQPALFLGVPADTHPFAGDFDVAVRVGERSAPLQLRCGVTVWLSTRSLDPARRVGRLGAGDLEQARHAVREARGAPEDWISPELEDWHREVIAPAASRVGAVLPFPSRRASFAAAAAAALLLLSLGLGGWLLQQNRQLARLRAEQTAARETLRQLEAQAAHEEELRKQSAAREAQRREEIVALEGREKMLSQPVINLPLALLTAESVRGGPKTISLPAEAPVLVAVLVLPEGKEYPVYRLDLIRQADDRSLWSSSALRESDGELRIALPRRWLTPGTYRLRLFGQRAGRSERLGEYQLAIAP